MEGQGWREYFENSNQGNMARTKHTANPITYHLLYGQEVVT